MVQHSKIKKLLFCSLGAIVIGRLYSPAESFAASKTPTPVVQEAENPSQIQVSFSLNYKTKNVCPDKIVTYKKRYGTLTVPARRGYTFLGWFTEPKKGTQVKSRTKVKNNQNHTLYAHWSVNKYKIKLNPNGGKVSKKNYTKTYGKQYGTLATPERKGYAFDGWHTKKVGGTLITSDAKVKVTKNTTLYAHWKEPYPQVILNDYSMSYTEYSTFPYNQCQNQYKSIMLGNSSYSLARSGCLTCNIALIMTYHGIPTNPVSLARNKNLYTGSGNLIWGNLPDQWYQVFVSGQYALQKCYDLLDQGYMPAVCLQRPGGMHWVVISGYEGGDTLTADKFMIFDSGSSKTKNLQDVLNTKGSITRVIYMERPLEISQH